MSNLSHQFISLKAQLAQKKEQGVKFVIWQINSSKKEFIENQLGYKTEEYIYSIKTRHFSADTRKQYGILKRLHYTYNSGKPWLNTKLKIQEKEVLDEFDIIYKVLRYKIYLV